MIIVLIVLVLLVGGAFQLAFSLGRKFVPATSPAQPSGPWNRPIVDHCNLHPEYFAGCGDCENCKMFAETVAHFDNKEGEA